MILEHAPATLLVTLLTLILYFHFSFNVGRARMKYGIAAPATTGAAEFERVFRVQQNTLEQLIVFLPLIWLAAFTLNDAYAAFVGFLFPLGRWLYARDYVRDPQKRGKGFLLGFLSVAFLFFGILFAVGIKAMAHAS